jgi:hypothetical protein
VTATIVEDASDANDANDANDTSVAGAATEAASRPAAAPDPDAEAAAAGGEALAPGGAVDPERVRFFRGPGGVLRCTVDGDRTVLRAKVVWAFPLSQKRRWLSVLDGANKEVCLIADPEALDAGSRELLRQEAAAYYREARIQRIHKIANEYRTLYWDVTTDGGRRDFVMKWAPDTVIWLDARKLLLVDVDTNRFVIDDVTALDKHSLSQLDVLF